MPAIQLGPHFNTFSGRAKGSLSVDLQGQGCQIMHILHFLLYLYLRFLDFFYSNSRVLTISFIAEAFSECKAGHKTF